jgi:hemerythrin HHE cation binding domain-containing protein
MAARKKPAARKQPSARRSSSRVPRDALALLRADHQTVQGLFDKFEKARGDDRKNSLAQQICSELKVHAQIEEEIFYPAVRGAIRDEDLLDEATVEHQSAKDLIAQIESADAGDDLFDAKVTVLGEYIKHHVKEEQNEMFPQVRKTKLDLRELGERLMARKEELKASGTAGRKSPPSGGLSGSGARRAQRSEEKTSEADSDGIFARMARGIGVSGAA